MLISLALAALLVFQNEAVTRMVGAEAYKIFLQFILVAVIGGGVSLVYQAVNRDADLRTERIQRDEERALVLRESRRRYPRDLVEQYNAVKRARRMLRAQALTYQPGATERRVRVVKYDEFLQAVLDAQLSPEAVAHIVRADDKLFPTKGALTASLRPAEGYENHSLFASSSAARYLRSPDTLGGDPEEVSVTEVEDRPAAPKDRDAIGTIFIGVLFAAVVTKVLELSSSNATTATGKTQLVLAAALTITSWIGYHNSRNRASYEIHFFNLPLARFAIEMLHVYLYWLVATTAEQRRATPSALPEAILLTAVFAFYICWDQVALAMRRSVRYPELDISADRPRRRHVTAAFCGVFALFVPLSIIAKSASVVIVIDSIFMACLIGHRALQHNFRDPVRQIEPESSATGPDPSPEA
jgi:hypothetical protein